MRLPPPIATAFKAPIGCKSQSKSPVIVVILTERLVAGIAMKNGMPTFLRLPRMIFKGCLVMNLHEPMRNRWPDHPGRARRPVADCSLGSGL